MRMDSVLGHLAAAYPHLVEDVLRVEPAVGSTLSLVLDSLAKDVHNWQGFLELSKMKCKFMFLTL